VRPTGVRVLSSAVAAMLGVGLSSCGVDDRASPPSDDERSLGSGVSPSPSGIEPRVGASIAVGDFPQDVAVVGRSVWVLVHDGDPADTFLVAVDASENEITRRVRLDTEATRIIGTGGALWVVTANASPGGRGEALLRMDPRTGEVTARIPGLRDPFAYGDGGLWATSDGDRPGVGALVRIDPTTAQIESTIEIPGLAVYLAVGEGAVWVMAYKVRRGSIVGGQILRVDARSGSVTEAFPGGDRTMSLPVVVGGFVWISGEDEGRTGMFRLDPETGQVVGEPLVFGTSINSPVGVSDGGIWYIGDRPGGQVISRLNTATREFDSFLELDLAVARPSIDLAATLAPGWESLWLASHRRSVLRIDMDGWQGRPTKDVS
jgi:streptogramin lyase